MKLYSIETGRFKLDGGAMFGVVPKVIWQKTNPADSNNRIDMAMRCLLIETGNQLVLIDNGIGHKYNAKFAELYAIDHSTTTLDSSLQQLGFSREDITDVILTHLHFDHCGGSTEWNPTQEKFVIAFPKARFWIQESQFNWALFPNAREKASYFPENLEPIRSSGQLKLIQGSTEIVPNMELVIVNGHTEGMMCPLITVGERKLLYAADLFPTYGHLPLPYVMGYDTRPLLSLEERKPWLERCVKEKITLFYEHDPYHECGTVRLNEKGGFQSGKTFTLQDWLSGIELE
ncbi:MAG: MBL fold metallo-hydrolase [Bacteroidia bacterium]|nr:MBL fold metallo-hydrolase [Bacteroidia bacterium]